MESLSVREVDTPQKRNIPNVFNFKRVWISNIF